MENNDQKFKKPVLIMAVILVVLMGITSVYDARNLEKAEAVSVEYQIANKDREIELIEAEMKAQYSAYFFNVVKVAVKNQDRLEILKADRTTIEVNEGGTR